jgi:hypothetical protein
LRPTVTLILSVIQFNQHNIIGLQEHDIIILLAEKMFRNYNSSLLKEHKVCK